MRGNLIISAMLENYNIHPTLAYRNDCLLVSINACLRELSGRKVGIDFDQLDELTFTESLLYSIATKNNKAKEAVDGS